MGCAVMTCGSDVMTSSEDYIYLRYYLTGRGREDYIAVLTVDNICPFEFHLKSRVQLQSVVSINRAHSVCVMMMTLSSSHDRIHI